MVIACIRCYAPGVKPGMRNAAAAGVLIVCGFWFAHSRARAQSPQPPPPAPYSPPNSPPSSTPAAPLLTQQQLDNLVAPIALYPDPLVSELLAASTYPMEVAEAQQFLADHPKWKPPKLVDEAKKQKWDPSVQGLVAFPQVLAMMTQDIAWTTQLGNAFLAQQPDVMQAVQRMRAQAEAAGKLRSTPQEQVDTATQNGQSAITIMPANPDVWYVPDYNPAYVWGPPAYGFYPPLLYPGIDVGFGWYPGFDIGLCFGGWGGWGWGGWGWQPNWFGGGIILNHSFFHRYGYGHFHGEPLGTSAWSHNPEHRLGVPYGNREVASRFAGRSGTVNGGFNRGDAFAGGRGSGAVQPRNSFQSRPDYSSVFGQRSPGNAARMGSDHGFSSMGPARTGGFRGGGFGGGGGGFRGGGGGGFHGGGGGRR
jgi:hypothetical protein